MENQNKVIQPTLPFPSEVDEDKQSIHRILYKVLASHFLNRSELELELGDDLLDTIWQFPYDRLPEKERKRYDQFIDRFCSKIGTKQSMRLFLVNPEFSVIDSDESVELYQSLENIRIKKGGASAILGLRFIMKQCFQTMENLIANEGMPTEEDVEFLELMANRLKHRGNA